GEAHRIEDYPSEDFEKVLRVNLHQHLSWLEVRAAIDDSIWRRSDLQHGLGGGTYRAGWHVRVRGVEAWHSRTYAGGLDGERGAQHPRQHARPGVDGHADGPRGERPESRFRQAAGLEPARPARRTTGRGRCRGGLAL